VGDHRPVTPNLHVDPAAPRAGAAALAATLPELRTTGLEADDIAVLAGLPGGGALVAEHDRLAAAVARRLRELADVVEGLDAAAGAIVAAEQRAAAALWAVGR
jgi:hypothetical protein